MRITPTGVKVRLGSRIAGRHTAFAYLDVRAEMHEVVCITVSMTKWRSDLGS